MIHIDELHITMPGSDKEIGNELGKLVSERLTAVLPENFGNQQIPELRLQLQSSTSIDTTFMANQIAEEIIRQIKLSTL